MRNVPHRFWDLKMWSAVGDAVWGSLGGTALLEEVCLRGQGDSKSA